MRTTLIVIASLTILPLSFDVNAQWVRTSCPPAAIVSFTASGAEMFAGSGIGNVYRSTDTGKTWSDVSNGLPIDYQNTRVLATDSGVFAVNWSMGVFRSTDHGAHWIPKHNGLAGAALEVTELMQLGNVLLIGTEGGVYRSTDFGDHWTAAAAGSPQQAFHFATENGMVYVGTNGAWVWSSPDTGKTWTSLDHFDFGGAHACLSLAVHNGVLFSGFYHGVFRSTDSGGTWVQSVDMQQMATGSLLINGQDLWAANDSGVFRSQDNGVHWTNENFGFSDSDQYAFADSMAFAIGQNGNYLFLGSRNNGVWRRSLSDLQNASVTVDRRLPSTLSPNPAVNVVTVSHTSHVTVTNMLGMSVMEINGHDRGNLTLDISKLAAGTYFVRSDGSATLQKLIKE